MARRSRIVNYLGLVIVSLAVVIFSFAFSLVRDRQDRKGLELSFYDVGQGSAAFIQTPEGYQILIDGGPDKLILNRLGENLPFWDRNLDLVILTHPHADHLSGLLYVLDRYQIDLIISNPFEFESEAYQEWQSLIAGELEVRSLYAGEGFCLEEVCFTALWPPFVSEQASATCSVLDEDRCHPWASDNVNNGSLVLLMTYGDMKILFTGDAEGEVWAALNQAQRLVDVDVLQVSHHGSSQGLAWEALEILRPELSVVSVGYNSFGHPNSQVLGWADQLGQVWRTDERGTLLLEF